MAIYNVHAGHCPQGKGASGAVGLLYESVENRKVKDRLISNLRSAGNTAYDCTDDTKCSERQNLYNIVAKCNAHSVSLDFSMHLDAGRNDLRGDGSTGGCTVLVTGYHDYAVEVAGRIAKEVSAALGIRNRGVVTRRDLYVLNHTNAPSILVECCFVDDADDVKKWDAIKCADAISAAITGQAVAAWVKDKIGWWYRYANGSYPKAQWLKLDAWYYFGAKGYAFCNEWIFYKNKWYYLKDDCRMAASEWQKVDGFWYYLGADGAMLDGWQKISGKWYYLDPDGEDRPHGAMVTGAITIDGYDYMLKDSGEMVTGWYQEGDDWHYYNEDKNCQPVGSKMQNHWQGAYYLKDDGRMAQDETLKIGGKEYVFTDDGKVQ